MKKAVSFVIRLLSVPLFLSVLMFFAAIMEDNPEKIIPWEKEETVAKPAAKVVIYDLLIENAGECATAEDEGREVARHCYDNPLIELSHQVREEMMIFTKRNEDRSLRVRAKFDYYKIVRQGFRRLAQHINSLRGGQKDDDGHQ